MLQEIEKDYMALSKTLQQRGTRLRGQQRRELMLADKRKKFVRFCEKNLVIVGMQYRVRITEDMYIYTYDRDEADDLLYQKWVEKRS